MLLYGPIAAIDAMEHMLFLPYTHPDAAACLQAVDAQLAHPGPPIVQDWLDFDRLMARVWPASDRAWRADQFRLACHHQELVLREASCEQLAGALSHLALPPGYLDTPAIIPTFHTGSYRILGAWLAMQGIPFSLLVAGQVRQEQEAIYWRTLAPYLRQKADFAVLDADDPGVLFAMRSALTRGHCLLVYADGNVGGRSHTHRIRLGETWLRVPLGIGLLARLMAVPVQPIWTIREPDGLRFLLHTPYYGLTPAGQTREDRLGAARNCMDHLYGLFLRGLPVAPWQWECWYYLDELWG